MSGRFMGGLVKAADLATTGAGKGAEMVADQDGGTVQDHIDSTDAAVLDLQVSVSGLQTDSTEIGKRLAYNLSGEWGIYTEELDGNIDHAAAIARLGVGYVIYYCRANADAARIANAKADFANFKKHGIGVLLWVSDTTNTTTRTTYISQYLDVENLIGWYVFDEPTAKSISLADQSAGIAASKAVKNLPCYCADHGDFFPNFGLSPEFDFVFVDSYYQIQNGNAPVLTDTQALACYGNVRSFTPVYGMNRIIPVYETYLDSVAATDIDESEKLRSLIAKRRMFGPGAFFIYKAGKTNPGMLGIGNTDKLRRTAEAVMQSPVLPDRIAVANYLCLLNTTFGYTDAKQKASLVNMVDARTTGTLEYNPERLPSRSGVFLTGSQSLVLDFGRVLKSVQIRGRFFNNSSALGTASAFNVIIPEAQTMATGVATSVTLPGTSGGGTANFAVTLEDANTRYVVIKPTGANWNTLTGFDALGYVGLEF